jgi:hypothetical protein
LAVFFPQTTANSLQRFDHDTGFLRKTPFLPKIGENGTKLSS